MKKVFIINRTIFFRECWEYVGKIKDNTLYLLEKEGVVSAVRKGFEPPKQSPVYTLSKRAP